MANLNTHTLYINDQLSNAKTEKIVLVIYPNGITKASYAKNNKAIEILTITTDNTTQYMEEMLFNEIINNYLLDTKELVTHIYIAPEQGMLVPAALHEPTRAEQWYRAIHFAPNNHLIHQCPFDNGTAMYIMHYPKYLLQTIDTHFENARIKPLASCFSATQKNQNTLITVHLHNAYCMLTHFEHGHLHSHQIMHNSTLEEITQQLNIMLANSNAYLLEVSTNDTNANAKELIGSYFGEHMTWISQNEFYQHLAACE